MLPSPVIQGEDSFNTCDKKVFLFIHKILHAYKHYSRHKSNGIKQHVLMSCENTRNDTENILN